MGAVSQCALPFKLLDMWQFAAQQQNMNATSKSFPRGKLNIMFKLSMKTPGKLTLVPITAGLSLLG